MEALLSQFTFLSDQSLNDKSFDPSTIEDLMKLFEIESYKAWAAAELEQEIEVEEAEDAMQEAEEQLDSAMERAMDEFRRFEEELERISRDEVDSLVETAEKARKMGNLMEKSASVASKKYIEAALNSATASMKSAWKGISSGKFGPSSSFFSSPIVLGFSEFQFTFITPQFLPIFISITTNSTFYNHISVPLLLYFKFPLNFSGKLFPFNLFSNCGKDC
ncbi:hypothetical protein P8452_15177 [Trifolium repens]|nr:hypothetical protein P8452_15177 [Trifolium repens]